MLNPKKKYLQIAFNRSLEEVVAMIYLLPLSERILIEAGYPLIKNYGVEAISTIKSAWQQRIFNPLSEFIDKANRINFPKKDFARFLSGKSLQDKIDKEITQDNTSQTKRFKSYSEQSEEQGSARRAGSYIIADLKCMDRAFTEVEAASRVGASAATCLGLAPVETIDAFIKKCGEIGMDSVIDMLNIEYPFQVLSKLTKPPAIVMLHRGVDEREENREKEIPYHEIERMKSVYDDVLIAVAGGETINEVITGAFNDADIIVVWRLFNENPEKITALSNEFLKEVK